MVIYDAKERRAHALDFRETAPEAARKELYMKDGCYQCHGREGQGSPATGPRLGPGPSPLAAFVRYTRAPRGEMPPYTAKVVSDQDLADMHAFLESRPKPPAVRDVFPPEGAHRPGGGR